MSTDDNRYKESNILCAGSLVILIITIGVPSYFIVVGIKDKMDSIDYNKDIDIYNKENKWTKDICYIIYVSNITTNNSSFTFNWSGYIVENNILNSSFTDFSREKIEKVWNSVNNSIDGLPINCYRNNSKTEISIRDRSKSRDHKDVYLVKTILVLICLSILCSGISIIGWIFLASFCYIMCCLREERSVPQINIIRRESTESLDTIAGVVPDQESPRCFVEIKVNGQSNIFN